MDQDKIIGYRFEPVLKKEFSGMQVSTCTCCPISNAVLTGCGGRKDIIHPLVKEMLLSDDLSLSLMRTRFYEWMEENKKKSEQK